MENNNSNNTSNPTPAPLSQAATVYGEPDLSQRLHYNKALVAIVAVLGVTVMALAAALVVNRSEAQPGVPAAAVSATLAPASTRLSQAPAPGVNALVKHDQRAPEHAPMVVAQSQPRAAVCASCGTVESVSAIQRQGQVNGVNVGNTTVGLGTVAGGLVGGLLGNQVGGGNGKTALTVLGVAGGAFAGNQIEKNMKKVTVYAVRVRMDDGTTRTLEVSSSVPVGSRVTVEGKNLRLA